MKAGLPASKVLRITTTAEGLPEKASVILLVISTTIIVVAIVLGLANEKGSAQQNTLIPVVSLLAKLTLW